MWNALLLDADYSPLRVVCWERAVILVLSERATLVERYVGRQIRSVSLSVPWPAVVTLRQFVGVGQRVRFNRSHVLSRDGYTCQYCGRAPVTRTGVPDRGALTLDHVIPRARSVGGQVTLPGGARVPVTSWENVVTACAACNFRKADRTPAEARMTLRNRPRRPSRTEMLGLTLARVCVPDEWRPYLPLDEGTVGVDARAVRGVA